MIDLITYDYIWSLSSSTPVGVEITHNWDGARRVVWYGKDDPVDNDLYKDQADQIAIEEDRRILKELLETNRELPRCECGAATLGSPFHSEWCPLA